eukprot:5222626-Prorocentrum_lima.AAC.1
MLLPWHLRHLAAAGLGDFEPRDAAGEQEQQRAAEDEQQGAEEEAQQRAEEPEQQRAKEQEQRLSLIHI